MEVEEDQQIEFIQVTSCATLKEDDSGNERNLGLVNERKEVEPRSRIRQQSIVNEKNSPTNKQTNDCNVESFCDAKCLPCVNDRGKEEEADVQKQEVKRLEKAKRLKDVKRLKEVNTETEIQKKVNYEVNNLVSRMDDVQKQDEPRSDEVKRMDGASEEKKTLPGIDRLKKVNCVSEANQLDEVRRPEEFHRPEKVTRSEDEARQVNEVEMQEDSARLKEIQRLEEDSDNFYLLCSSIEISLEHYFNTRLEPTTIKL